MPLKIKVKVGKVTNLSDARYCAGMGADLLGFPIGNDPGQISIEQFHEITEWVAGPQFVFEPGNKVDQDFIKKVTSIKRIDHIQVPFRLLDEYTTYGLQKPFIIETELSSVPSLALCATKTEISYIIITGVSSDIDWAIVEQLNRQVPVLIDQSFLSISNLSSLLEKSISGMALTGTEETQPGKKEYGLLADVLEQLEVD